MSCPYHLRSGKSYQPVFMKEHADLEEVRASLTLPDCSADIEQGLWKKGLPVGEAYHRGGGIHVGAISTRFANTEHDIDSDFSKLLRLSCGLNSRLQVLEAWSPVQ